LKNSEYADGKVVEIKGFLYKDSRGNTILANEPNLKTCCISAKQEQIRLLGNIDISCQSRPFLVRGHYSIKAMECKQSNFNYPLYTIDPVIIHAASPEKNTMWVFLLLLAIGIAAAMVYKQGKFL